MKFKTMQLKHKIPEIYHNLLPDLLSMTIPEEKLADCKNCQYLLSPKLPQYYTKCCDFHPNLPNYMAGGILSSENPMLAEGKERILKKIEKRAGISPYGILRPQSYRSLLDAHRKNKIKSDIETYQKLKCPYYQNGFCTVYQFRSEVCPTHYCMSSGGTTGLLFWKAVKKYFVALEFKLSCSVLIRLGFPETEIFKNYSEFKSFQQEEENDIPIEKIYENLWGNWVGREVEFYKQSYQIIKDLNTDEINKIVGKTLDKKEASVREFNAKFLQNEISDGCLIFNPDEKLLVFDDDGFIKFEYEGKIERINKHQLKFLQQFTGERDTLSIVQKALVFKANISGLIIPLIKTGLMREVCK